VLIYVSRLVNVAQKRVRLSPIFYFILGPLFAPCSSFESTRLAKIKNWYSAQQACNAD